MCLCDTCKVEASIRKSNEPACCAWYLENVVVGGASVNKCPVYKPIESMQVVHSKLCSALTGHIVRWLDSNQFIALIINRDGRRGEMICHTDYWYVV
jgi:hypothetical protein